jgi:4-amino-4-deoxy-L-arabinose transferase-like glycosyltransferase
MLETGDFLRIRLQDEPRNKKPIGIYWMQAASVAAFSDVEEREIWAWRVPSMLGAVIAVLATFWGGMVLVGRRAAFVGAALLATSVLLSTEGMIAKTDAMLCALTALAMSALARVFMRKGGKRTVIVFWAALACGILVKGPIAPMVVGLAIGALLIWTRDLRRLAPLLSPIGAALTVAILTPWLHAISRESGGALVLADMTRDIAPKIGGGGEHGSRPPGLHLLLLPLLIFPASIGLAPAFTAAMATLRAPKGDAAHDGVRFLLAWAAPAWIVFELATTKLAHYTLPLYPAISLLAGAGLMRCLETAAPVRKRALLAGFAIGGAGFALLLSYAATWSAPVSADPIAHVLPWLATCAGVLLVALGAMALAKKPASLLAATLAGALALLFIGREIIIPRADHVLVSHAVAHALEEAGLNDRASPLLVVGYREPSLVFAEGTDTVLRQGPQAGNVAVEGQAVLVEGRERGLFEIALLARKLAFTPVGPPVTGLNYSNGDEVSLQPGRVTALNAARN